jgi:hypothetical protein
MRAILLSGLMSLAVAIFTVIGWHFRRKHRGWPRRKPDYVWVFIHGGIIYVMAALLVEHNLNGTPYSDILSHGFGEAQVNVAFIGAIYEAGWTLWDMWNGDGNTPAPGV